MNLFEKLIIILLITAPLTALIDVYIFSYFFNLNYLWSDFVIVNIVETLIVTAGYFVGKNSVLKRYMEE